MARNDRKLQTHFKITNRITAGLTRVERARGFLEHGGLTIREFERIIPDVKRRSLQRDLKAMVGKGLLAANGKTNQLVYRLEKES